MISLKNMGKGLLNLWKYVLISFALLNVFPVREVVFRCCAFQILMYWIVQYYGVDIDGPASINYKYSFAFFHLSRLILWYYQL